MGSCRILRTTTTFVHVVARNLATMMLLLPIINCLECGSLAEQIGFLAALQRIGTLGGN
jgi:hypothetical protein